MYYGDDYRGRNPLDLLKTCALGVAIWLGLLSGCGGVNSLQPGAESERGGPPSLDQLHAVLTAEFNRLGIDPIKVVAAASSVPDNAVFDLSAVVLDPDGPPMAKVVVNCHLQDRTDVDGALHR